MSALAASGLAQFGRSLERAWSDQSSTRWRADNPALGQCGVTSLVVNDAFGGDILKTRVEGAWHFYNCVDGRRVDFTASQFSTPLDHDDVVSNRSDAFADTNAQQYDALTARLRAAQQEG